MFINCRKRRAVPHRVASQGNATYCEPGFKNSVLSSRRGAAGRDAARCGRDFVFINRRKHRAVPHPVASQGNYCLVLWRSWPRRFVKIIVLIN